MFDGFALNITVVSYQDGLDIGICRIDGNERLHFAGAKIPLFILREKQVNLIKGDNRSIGYRRSGRDLKFTTHDWAVQQGDIFYLTTDGYPDQNGGEKDLPLGRNRLMRIIAEQETKEVMHQQTAFARALHEYMGSEPQRDDITVVGFSLK